MKPSTLIRYLAVSGKVPAVFEDFETASRLVLFVDDHMKAVPPHTSKEKWERIITGKFYEVLSSSCDALAPASTVMIDGVPTATTYQDRVYNFFSLPESNAAGFKYKLNNLCTMTHQTAHMFNDDEIRSMLGLPDTPDSTGRDRSRSPRRTGGGTHSTNQEAGEKAMKVCWHYLKCAPCSNTEIKDRSGCVSCEKGGLRPTSKTQLTKT
ncbi:unnamed protein product, partial [Amoebophrya sp. A120]|eukprot:GSA120T00026217001.1